MFMGHFPYKYVMEGFLENIQLAPGNSMEEQRES